MTSGDDLKTYAQRLAAARKAIKGMSQTDLAELAGTSQSQVSDLEKGKSEGSSFTAQFAHHLHVEAYWLATGEGPRKRRSGAVLDIEALEDAIETVEADPDSRKEPPDRKAKIVSVLYQHAVSEEKLEPTEVLEMLRPLRK